LRAKIRCRSSVVQPVQGRVDRGHPARIVGGQGADRPVAAEQQTRRAEALQGVIEIRTQVRRRPGRVVGLRRHAAQLADDVGQGGELAQLGAPRIELPRADAGLAQVIEHEAHLRALPHQPDDIRELPVIDAEVETETKPRQQPHAAHEIRSQAEGIVGLVLQQPAHALDPRDGRRVAPATDATASPCSSGACATMPAMRGSSRARPSTHATSASASAPPHCTKTSFATATGPPAVRNSAGVCRRLRAGTSLSQGYGWTA
jgi:hypothetical protein